MSLLPLETRDAQPVRRWLDQRKRSLEDIRSHFEPLWREIRKYFEPNIGRALIENRDVDSRESQRDDENIINSETRMAVERYSAGMQSGITNKAQQWLSIVPRYPESNHIHSPEINAWCARLTTEVVDALERGSFYRCVGQVYAHAAQMGTSVMMILRGEEAGDVLYSVIDEGDYWLAQNRRGHVDTLMRRMTIPVSQAFDEFWFEALPEGWKSKMEDGRNEERVEVYNLICPVDVVCDEVRRVVGGDAEYVSVYWTVTDSNDIHGVLDIRRFSYKPFAVMRQSDGHSVYGKGIGEKCLPDAKELQELERIILKLVAYEAEPPMLAPSTMKHSMINLLPGGVTYYDSIMGNNIPVQRLFETRQGLDKVANYIQIVGDRVSRMWFNDLFSMMLSISRGDRLQRTATEVSELSAEKVTLLGPVLTQMDDFLNDVVDATLAILVRDGVAPTAPEEVLETGVEISVEYTSMIHTEMKASLKMRSINQLIEVAGMLGQFNPTVLDKVDLDKIVDDVGRIFPGASEFILKTEDANAIRQSRAHAEQQQVQQAQFNDVLKTAGRNVKALSEARVGNGNALDALVSGLA